MSMWGCVGSLKGMARRVGFSGPGAILGSTIGSTVGSAAGMASTFMYNRSHPEGKKSIWMHGAVLGSIKGSIAGGIAGGLGAGWKK